MNDARQPPVSAAGLSFAPSLAGRVRTLFGETIPRDSLGHFFDAVAALLRAGQSVPQALRRASLGGDRELEALCRVVAPALERGVSLTDALLPFAGRLPELVPAVLEAGEVSGSLEAAARRLAENFHHEAGLRRRFRYNVFHPGLVIAALAVLSGAPLAGQPPADVIRAVLTNGGMLTVGYLAARLVWQWTRRLPWLRRPVDTVGCALPGVGLTVRNLAAARWARSFATLWGAGLPVSRALEVSSRSACNAHYERALLRAARQTRHGAALSACLAGTPLLPAHLVSVIATGEAVGNMAETLDRLASLMEEDALARAAQTMNGAVVVGTVVLAAYMIGHA